MSRPDSAQEAIGSPSGRGAKQLHRIIVSRSIMNINIKKINILLLLLLLLFFYFFFAIAYMFMCIDINITMVIFSTYFNTTWTIT